MSDPFRLEGPLCVSFSGGRTSGYMLRRILDAGLPDDAFVVFANTGKEREETLDFVHEIETRWSVPIRWIEWVDASKPADRWREVDYETASRDGEPFEALIRKKNYLPNPVARFCTQHLKIEATIRFLQAQGWTEWTNAVGIRYDEPRRWRIEGVDSKAKFIERVLPLRHGKVTEQDVLAFWDAQPFNLQLQPWESNCDLCFLKGVTKRQRIMGEHPELADWWIRQEETVGSGFRGDRPRYLQLLKDEQNQLRIDFNEEDMLPCACTD